RIQAIQIRLLRRAAPRPVSGVRRCARLAVADAQADEVETLPAPGLDIFGAQLRCDWAVVEQAVAGVAHREERRAICVRERVGIFRMNADEAVSARSRTAKF